MNPITSELQKINSMGSLTTRNELLNDNYAAIDTEYIQTNNKKNHLILSQFHLLIVNGTNKIKTYL